MKYNLPTSVAAVADLAFQATQLGIPGDQNPMGIASLLGVLGLAICLLQLSRQLEEYLAMHDETCVFEQTPVI